MINKLFRSLTLTLILVLAALPLGVVFAKEITSLTISGPGIQGVLTLDDPQVIQKLIGAGLIDQSGVLAKPSQELGTPYTITVNLDLEGKVVPFLRMDYYPLEEGQAGYVHYTGRYDGSSLHEQDEWGLMALPADNLFRELMAAEGIVLQPAVKPAPAAAEPAVQPAPVASASSDTLPLLSQPAYIAVVALILLAAAGGLLIRRRVLHRSASRS